MPSFVKELLLDGNQMLFNLDVPSSIKNVAFKSSAPQPVVIEKMSQGHMKPTAETVGCPRIFLSIIRLILVSLCLQSLRFSAVSQESLSNAVTLAKRDMRKMKEQRLSGMSLNITILFF